MTHAGPANRFSFFEAILTDFNDLSAKIKTIESYLADARGQADQQRTETEALQTNLFRSLPESTIWNVVSDSFNTIVSSIFVIFALHSLQVGVHE